MQNLKRQTSWRSVGKACKAVFWSVGLTEATIQSCFLIFSGLDWSDHSQLYSALLWAWLKWQFTGVFWSSLCLTEAIIHRARFSAEGNFIFASVVPIPGPQWMWEQLAQPTLNAWPNPPWMPGPTHLECRLHIQMSINQQRLFLWVISQLAKQNWWQFNLGAIGQSLLTQLLKWTCCSLLLQQLKSSATSQHHYKLI